MINYEEECRKLAKELHANYGIDTKWCDEGTVFEIYVKVRDQKLIRFFNDLQDLYCWLDAFKAGMEAASILIAPNGATYFD